MNVLHPLLVGGPSLAELPSLLASSESITQVSTEHTAVLQDLHRFNGAAMFRGSDSSLTCYSLGKSKRTAATWCVLFVGACERTAQITDHSHRFALSGGSQLVNGSVCPSVRPSHS